MLWNDAGGQAVAIAKGVVFDVRYIFGYVDIKKAETIVKSVPSDCFCIVTDYHLLQFLLILKPVCNVSAIDIQKCYVRTILKS